MNGASSSSDALASWFEPDSVYKYSFFTPMLKGFQIAKCSQLIKRMGQGLIQVKPKDEHELYGNNKREQSGLLIADFFVLPNYPKEFPNLWNTYTSIQCIHLSRMHSKSDDFC